MPVKTGLVQWARQEAEVFCVCVCVCWEQIIWVIQTLQISFLDSVISLLVVEKILVN